VSDGLSARDVAQIIGVPESRVRYWAQIGLVGPTYKESDDPRHVARPRYAFTDLVAAKAAHTLTERGIPARRVREALIALRAQLPSLARPILHLRVLSDGERLVVAGDEPYEPLSGQRVMDFGLDELSQQLATLDGERRAVPRAIGASTTRKEVSAPPTPQTSIEWFELGLHRSLEGNETGAAEAYEAALVLDPDLAPAHTNLAAQHAAAERWSEAERHLDHALRCDPTSIEARSQRAALYERCDEPERALSLWASLLADVPSRPAVRAGVTRATAAVKRRLST
jgi:tetratricopeptide (TPR) repeat protein